MNRLIGLSVLGIAVLGSLGCDRRADVNREVDELKKAQNAAPEVAQELRGKLDQKKAEVVQLEEKLALAERGVTDNVIRERNELHQALKHEEQRVKREVDEARGASQTQKTETERAREALDSTRPPGRIEAEVETQRKETPSSTRVDVERQQQQQEPLETYRTVERPTQQPSEDQEKQAEPPR